MDEMATSTLWTAKKDMIISGGFNVYCAEVEAAIMARPGPRGRGHWSAR